MRVHVPAGGPASLPPNHAATWVPCGTRIRLGPIVQAAKAGWAGASGSHGGTKSANENRGVSGSTPLLGTTFCCTTCRSPLAGDNGGSSHFLSPSMFRGSACPAPNRVADSPLATPLNDEEGTHAPRR